MPDVTSHDDINFGEEYDPSLPVFVTALSREAEVLESGWTIVAAELGIISHHDAEITVPVLFFQLKGCERDKPEDLALYPDTIECRVRNKVYPYCPLGFTRVLTCISTQGERVYKGWDNLFVEELKKAAHEIGIRAGLNMIRLYQPTASGKREITITSPGEVCVYFKTVAVSGFDRTHPDKLFGYNLATQGGYYAHINTQYPRGELLRDEHGHHFGEVIGGNIYLSFDPIELMDESRSLGLMLFEKAFSIALLQVFRQEMEKLGDTFDIAPETGYVSDDRASHATTTLEHELDKWVNRNQNLALEAIEEIDGRIRKASIELYELRLERKRKLQTYRFLNDPEQGMISGLVTRVREDFAKIAAHPLVRSVEAHREHGLSIKTKTITITHHGKTYKIGEYTIWYSWAQRFSVITDHSYHKDSIPHPHISAINGCCFGNIGAAIEDAAVECRVYDLTTLIIEWLTNGYTPELIIYNKVEEWPEIDRETQEEMQHE